MQAATARCGRLLEGKPLDDPLYPLRFRLLVRRYLWGNRRLETCLGKKIGPGNDYAESWEIVDHGADQSVVDGGPLAGTTLGRAGAQSRTTNCSAATIRNRISRC